MLVDRRCGSESLLRRTLRRAAVLAVVLGIPMPVFSATIIVQPGDSIAAAIQGAQTGDVIQVQPGTYHEGAAGDLNALTITKSGIEIDGNSTADSPVILENAGGQSFGIWVSPADSAGAAAQANPEAAPCATSNALVKQFKLSGVTVRGFAEHGVHLACVDGFTLSGNISDSNDVYGLFPIFSHNGLITGNEVLGTGSDAAIYVGQSDHVVVSNNNVHDSLLGIEVQNSQASAVIANNVHDNTLGILVDVQEGHIIKTQTSTTVNSNQVYNNNRANTAEPGDVIAVLPAGIGILLVGGDSGVVTQNTVVANQFAGIGVVSLCLAFQLEGQGCAGLDVNPLPTNNHVQDNVAQGNGTVALGNQLDAFRGDLVWDGTGTGNCWADNTYGTGVPSNGLGTGAVLPVCGANPNLITAPALSAPGKVTSDALGMPTIQAASDNDAYFLQGYVHAQNRFFEMDLNRRAIAGTLASLVGSSQLANDVQLRTLGLRRAAERTWLAMSDDMRSWLTSYAAGVNFWLSTNKLPLEYLALDITKVDLWEPVDSISIGKGLAFQLSFDLDINPTIQLGAYQAAGHAVGFDGTLLFFGDVRRAAPADNRVTVPGFQPSAASPQDRSQAVGGVAGAASIAGAPAIGDVSATTMKLAQNYQNLIGANPLFQRAMQGRDSPVGSNEWAVSGANTASGKAILANDPHLSIAFPPVFTEVHLYSTDSRYASPMDVTGVSVPGTPGVIQGCNQRICWGTTTNGLDVTDTFQETLKLDSYGLPYAIVHDGVDEPVQMIFQSYFVNQLDGTPDHVVRDNSIGYLNGAITVIVPRRNNGPLVVIDSASSTGLSIAYTGWGATFELQSFRLINRAANLDDFRTALSFFDFGSQNFAYADVDGNIAYFTSGEAPVRTDLQAGTVGGNVPPFLIRDGSGVAHHDWLPVQHPQPNQATPYEILPASEMPYVINPAQGYFANANNDPIGYSLDNNPLNQLRPGGGIYYLDRGDADAMRVGRIDRVLSGMIGAGHKITSSDMQALQANTQSLDAELLLPYLLAAYDNANAEGAWSKLAALAADARVQNGIARLRAWDYSNPTGVQAGFDPGDNPLSLPAPSQAEQDASVAASIWTLWRSFVIRSTIDQTLAHVGLQSYLPGDSDSLTGLKFLLDAFPALQGKGASGLQFFNPQYFNANDAPNAAAARDFILLISLQNALNQFESGSMAPAFGGSPTIADYRWGVLHRVVFAHPLGGPFSIPGQDGFASPSGFTDFAPGLPGIARSGNWQTVNVGDVSLRGSGANDFMFKTSSARRFVGEMSSTIQATEVIPGGNSGVLGSPHYADQLPLWLSNLYHPLPIPVAQAAANPASEVDFHP